MNKTFAEVPDDSAKQKELVIRPPGPRDLSSVLSLIRTEPTLDLKLWEVKLLKAHISGQENGQDDSLKVLLAIKKEKIVGLSICGVWQQTSLFQYFWVDRSALIYGASTFLVSKSLREMYGKCVYVMETKRTNSIFKARGFCNGVHFLEILIPIEKDVQTVESLEPCDFGTLGLCGIIDVCPMPEAWPKVKSYFASKGIGRILYIVPANLTDGERRQLTAIGFSEPHGQAFLRYDQTSSGNV